MATLEQAHRAVETYAEQHGAVWFDRTVVDRGGYWFFPVGYIGSRGVMVDKADGRLSVMGSAPSPAEPEREARLALRTTPVASVRARSRAPLAIHPRSP
jgi:hypothetical protein